MSELRRVSSVLRTSARLPAVDPVLEQARDAWPEAVGPAIAAASQPARMTRDAMWVHCTSAAWVSELTMLEGDLRARLGERVAGLPGRLRFELGDVVRAPEAVRGAPLLAPDPEASARADELVSDVSDPVLRERIREAIELSLRRGS
jgi:hypothetical protein